MLKVNPDAAASLRTNGWQVGLSSPSITPFDTAKEAVAAAMEAMKSGKYSSVYIFVDGHPSMLQAPEIEQLHRDWT